MSNYCEGCRYDRKQRTGEDACPFNVFYWDFMIRHRNRFSTNRRMQLALRNVDKLPGSERKAIGSAARSLRAEFGIDVKEKLA